jgi:hypothetical protein
MLSAPKQVAEAEVEQAVEEIVLDPTLRLLCAVAIRDEIARAWLLEEPWNERLEDEPNTDLLKKILAAELHTDNPASVQTFLTTLDANEEAFVSGLLDEKPPVNPLAIANDAWRELDCRRVRRRIDARKARMRAPDLSTDEIIKLQKEVLDLTSHLSNISRPLSPPL